MTAHDMFRVLLRGGIIGQPYDEATLRALDIPEALWSQVRAAAGDVHRVHDAGAHQDSRDLADEWARFLSDSLGDNWQRVAAGDGTDGPPEPEPLRDTLVAKVGAPPTQPPPALNSEALIDDLRARLEGRNPTK